MTTQIAWLSAAVLVGLFATVVMDLWALLLRRMFGVASLSYCLVGRWLRHMPDGKFKHANISTAEKKRAECGIGWMAHYATGVLFSLLLVFVSSGRWLQEPALLPALLFGIVTVAVPFLVMQPAFGFGIAAARTPHPTKARMRSLLTHAVFGFGLYLGAVALNQVLQVAG